MPEDPRLPADDPRSGSPERRSGRGSERTPWRVDPAPDGRGDPGQKGRGPMGTVSWRRMALIVLGLLFVNYWVATLLPGGAAPARVSYTPFFLEQVQKGNVKSISSRGDTISGRFTKEVDPPGKAD